MINASLVENIGYSTSIRFIHPITICIDTYRIYALYNLELELYLAEILAFVLRDHGALQKLQKFQRLGLDMLALMKRWENVTQEK